MTVAEQTPITTAVGNGSSTVFPFGFSVLSAADLVVKGTLSGAVTVFVLGSDYSVTGVGGATGSVVFNVAPANGMALAIYRSSRVKRDTDYTDNGDLLAVTLDTDFDRLWLLMQEIFSGAKAPPGSLRVAAGETVGELPAASARAGYLLGFDNSGAPVLLPGQAGSATTLALDLAAANNAAKGVGQVGYDATVAYSAGLGAFLNLQYARTAAEVTAGVTPSVYAYPEGDIRRYGATTVAVNNATAINAALLVSASGGADVYIPPGTWAYTATLNATGSCAMRGCGQLSVLAPNGCDGITFANQPTYGGSRPFRDFVLTGTSTTAKSGIKATMTAASGNRVTSVFFDRLTIQNFQWGIDTQGFWNSAARDVHIYNCYGGVHLSERNIKFTFSSVHIVAGAITGVGTKYGVLLEQVGGVRSESTTLRGCFIFGYDIAIHVDNALYTTIEHVDCDNCQSVGIKLTTANGGTTVRDCWVNTNAAALTKGIEVSALGAKNHDQILLDSNIVSCTQAFAGSLGIVVGDEQQAVRAISNRVYGFETGIRCSAADNFIEKWNSINATSTARLVDSLSLDCEVGPSYIQGGTSLAFTAGTPTGLVYYDRGSFTATLTGMTAGTTGTVKWVANGREIRLQVGASITGTSNSTAMTLTGLPSVLKPVADQVFIPTIIDNGTTVHAYASLSASTGTITFGATPGAGNFTASGTKGVNAMTAAYVYSS